jgi:hypothetical protein
MEIKFRGYDEENKCWRYGHFFETVEGARRCYNIVENRETRYYCASDSIGQFIGKKDKNRKELYNKDIIKNINNSFIYVVEWVEEYSGFILLNIEDELDELFFEDINLDFFEYFGNIYGY